jgi:hypothetical protein
MEEQYLEEEASGTAPELDQLVEHGALLCFDLTLLSFFV